MEFQQARDFFEHEQIILVGYGATCERKKSGAAVSTPDGKRNLEEGLSMIPLSITVNHTPGRAKLQKFSLRWKRRCTRLPHRLQRLLHCQTAATESCWQFNNENVEQKFQRGTDLSGRFSRPWGSDATLAASRDVFSTR